MPAQGSAHGHAGARSFTTGLGRSTEWLQHRSRRRAQAASILAIERCGDFHKSRKFRRLRRVPAAGIRPKCPFSHRSPSAGHTHSGSPDKGIPARPELTANTTPQPHRSVRRCPAAVTCNEPPAAGLKA